MELYMADNMLCTSISFYKKKNSACMKYVAVQ